MDIKDVFRTTKIIKKTVEEVKKPQKLLAGVLVRVSTDRQAVEGDSLEMQKELAQALMKEKDGFICEYYIEDGLSASKTRVENRKEIQRLKQDIIDGKINCVIAYKRDRMFRNALESMGFFQFLVDHDCQLFLTARGEMQVDVKNLQGAGQIMEYLLAMFAQMESATTSARVSDTMISIALKGERTGGPLPLGYKYGENAIEPIEEAIPIIETIERMYLEGVGKKTIAKWLNGGDIKNYPTLPCAVPKPRAHTGKRATDTWNEKNIDTILFNPIYTGHTSYQSKKNPDFDRIIERSEKIIPVRTLEKQKEINDLSYKKQINKTPPRAYNTPFLLTGLLVCGCCGANFKTTTSQKKDGTRHSYYKCPNKYASPKAYTCKDSRVYRKETIEAIVLDTIKKALAKFLDEDSYELFQKKVETIRNKENDELELLNEKIKQKQEEFDNVTKIVASISNTEIQLKYIQSQEVMLKELNELKEARGILIEKLEIDEEENYDFAKFLSLAKEFGSIIEYSSTGVKKMLLEGFLEQIIVDKKGDIRLRLGIGIAKKEEDTIIPLETVGEPNVPKDIIVSSDKWDEIRVNYDKVLKTMHQKARNALYPFLIYKEPKFSYENFDLILEDELPNYKLPLQTSKIRSTKVNAYMQEKLNIGKNERERIMNGHVPSFQKLKEILSKVGATIDDFIQYIDTRHSGFLAGGEDILQDVLKSAKSKGTKGKYLFDGIIVCDVCGREYKGKRNTKSIRYTCIDNRADKGDKRCHSSSIREQDLVARFEEDRGEKINREVLLWRVEKITVTKDGEFNIHYKEKYAQDG